MGAIEADKVYQGLDLVWFPALDNSQMVTMSGPPSDFSQTFTAGDPLYDQFKMNRINNLSGIAVSLFFETTADALDFYGKVTSFIMNGVETVDIDWAVSGNSLSAFDSTLGAATAGPSSWNATWALAAAWAPVSLNAATTTYGMHYGEYVTNTTSNYQPMAWVTFQAADFTNAGLNLNGTQPSNRIATVAEAKTYENFLFDTSITRLAAQGCQDGTPICIDPEDLGFDKALFYHDIYRAWYDNWQVAAPNSFASQLNPYAYDGVPGADFGGTDITVAAPLIIQTMKNVKARLNEVYPNSPIGFYSVGSAAFWLTGWSGVYKNNTNSADALCKSWEIMNDVFTNNLTETGEWWGYKTLDVLDFAFNAFYPAQNDMGKVPFTRYGSELELLKGFLHLFIDKFSGTAQGAKMMVGVSVRANVPEVNLSGATLSWTNYANDSSLTIPNQPDSWASSTDTYPDFDSVAQLDRPDLNSPFVYTPMSIQKDLVKWKNLEDTDVPPTGFQTSPPGGSPGTEANMPALTGKSLRDFPMAIWDGGYITVYNGVDNDLYPSTLNDDEVETFRSLYTKQTIMDAYTAAGTGSPVGSWLATQMDTDAAEYINLFSSKGSQDWYEAPTGSTEIFNIDFTTMTSSTDVYVNGSTDAAIPNTDLAFENWGASSGTVWKVGSGGTQGIEPYKSNVHLYKDTNGSSQFSDGIVTDIGTLPSAFVMEGVIAEGGTNDNADYGFLVACDLSGSNVIRAGIINGNENTLEIRTRTNGGSYVDTVLPIQSIGSADQQFMRTTFDGTTITVEAWDGTDDSGTKLGTVTRNVAGLNMGTYFGFLGGKGISNSTQGRSCFSMKLTSL